MMPFRAKPQGCLSDFLLDRYVVRELDTGEEADARAHIASCARCEERLRERARERDAFAAEAPALQLRAPKKRRAWMGGAAAGLAAAASVALLIVTHHPREGEGTRAKGGAAQLDFYVSHAGAVRRGGIAERVGPGDAIRFVITVPEARYMAVLSIDGAKHASIYYPHGAEAERIDAASSVPLPESTVLDETLGDETIYGVFCAESFPLEPLRRALEFAPERAPSLDGCTLDAIHLRKEALAPP